MSGKIMMGKGSRSAVVLGACLTVMSSVTGATAAEKPALPLKPVMAKICMNCHKPEGNNVIRGYLDGVSFKAKMLQVRLDNAVEIFNFDKNTIQVVNDQRKAGDGELLRNNLMKKGHEVRVEFTEVNGVKTAIKLTAKPPVELPGEMLITTPELEELVKLGPEKGRYFLYDSRPAPRFQEGAIPGAANLPFPSFDKLAEKPLIDVRLPSETGAGMLKNAMGIPLDELRDRLTELPKDKTLIFYCNTGTQAEIAYNILKDQGYANVKYLDGKVKFEKDGSYSISKN